MSIHAIVPILQVTTLIALLIHLVHHFEKLIVVVRAPNGCHNAEGIAAILASTWCTALLVVLSGLAFYLEHGVLSITTVIFCLLWYFPFVAEHALFNKKISVMFTVSIIVNILVAIAWEAFTLAG